MMIEEALLEIHQHKSMRTLDRKLIARSCGIIKRHKDIPNELRITIAKRLKHDFYKKHPTIAPIKRKLGSWAKILVPEDNRLPRLDFDGKNMILYTGPFLMHMGVKIPKGTKRPSQGLWVYSKGSDIINQIIENWTYMVVVTDRANNYILTKVKEQKDKQRLISEVQDIKDADHIDFNLKLKSHPYPHQKKAIKIGTTLDRSALLMEQGTGKTLSAIAIAIQRFHKGQVKRILIVAPKSVLPEWAMQFKDHTDLPYKSVALNMKKAKKLKILNEWVDLEYGLSIITINYESLEALKNELVNWGPDMMILDESQNIKESRNVSAKACYYIADKADVQYRLILTGTPVSESPLDFFGQYRFLDPSIFGYSFSQFRDQYAKLDYWGKVKDILNIDELASKAHSIAFRVTKKEALKGLPPEKGIINEIVLDEKERSYYNQMEETSYLELSQESSISAPLLITQLLKLQQLAGGFIKDEEGTVHKVGDSKLNRMKEIIDQHVRDNHKAVIFCRFTPELEAIEDYLTTCGKGFEVLHGGTKDREKVLTNFKEDPNCLFFLAQIKAGGVGITLTAANTAIFYSTGYSLIDYEQAKARIHRIGQTKSVTYIHLVAKGTLDETIYESLKEKKSVSDLLVDQMKHINSRNHKEGISMGKLDEKLKQLRQTMETKDLKPNPKEDINMSEGTAPETKEEVKGKKGKSTKSTKSSKAEKSEKVEKAEKAEKAETVTLSQIADELGTNPAALRRLLRNSDIQKPEGRWEWPVGHEDIEAVKDLYNAPDEADEAEEDAEEE